MASQYARSLAPHRYITCQPGLRKRGIARIRRHSGIPPSSSQLRHHVLCPVGGIMESSFCRATIFDTLSPVRFLSTPLQICNDIAARSCFVVDSQLPAALPIMHGKSLRFDDKPAQEDSGDHGADREAARHHWFDCRGWGRSFCRVLQGCREEAADVGRRPGKDFGRRQSQMVQSKRRAGQTQDRKKDATADGFPGKGVA
jgi:hypothetical protein